MSATSTRNHYNARPSSDAVLVLADGRKFWGHGIGATGVTVGEVCFNTSITGYQEIITDPSYAGQIITFTFPHIGNVGTNLEDFETLKPAANGCIIRADISEPSNWRSTQHFDSWLKTHNLVGISGIDTRALTIAIREGGALIGALAHDQSGMPNQEELTSIARNWPGLEGMDLAREVSCTTHYTWEETRWIMGKGYGKLDAEMANKQRTEGKERRIVAVDFGAKHNILRCLASLGCHITVVPATATAKEVLSHKPNGVFLSNGPGDPAATGTYAVPMVQAVMDQGLPIFGICLGHQILALALGAKTEKMHHGHRGANHPVKELATGKVEITSQNHGFVVALDSLPEDVKTTHVSLFDGSLEGIAAINRPVFGVQYHPEASPGPQDSHYLFKRFISLIDQQ